MEGVLAEIDQKGHQSSCGADNLVSADGMRPGFENGRKRGKRDQPASAGDTVDNSRDKTGKNQEQIVHLADSSSKGQRPGKKGG